MKPVKKLKFVYIELNEFNLVGITAIIDRFSYIIQHALKVYSL